MNNILHPAHHGFRAGLSTTTALAQLFEIWSQAFDEGQTSAVLFLDLSLAFDVVDHSILLNKLKVYNFDENLIFWMKSYLTNRRQKVYIDGAFSDEMKL